MTRDRANGLRDSLAILIVMALIVTLIPAVHGLWAARADSAPLPPESLTTVSADALATAQINGVVWDQVIVGNVVYVTGKFSKARPPGSAAGVNEVTRNNAMAYDLTTGALLDWAPSLNAQGLTIAASTDGTRIFIGGDFTAVNGTTKNYLAAVDTAGKLISTFTADPNNRVKAMEVSGSTLYLGGKFTVVNKTTRTLLAAVATSSGALTSWAPTVDQSVQALTVPGNGTVVIGGGIALLNGATARGMGAVDATTGATVPWAVNQVIQNYGADSAILSLSHDGNQVYGTAYDFNGPSDFEGSFAATATGGDLVWLTGCKGDTYDSVPIGNVLYTVGHPHNCSSIGGHPQTSPTWTYQRTMATTTTADGVNAGGDFNGKPKPRLLAWTPYLAPGSYTGKTQAAWSVVGNGTYVALGGEFPSVNGTAQQGLVRFAVRTATNNPNKQGPQGSTELKPTLVPVAGASVRVSWTAAYDRDNRNLSYTVLRGTGTSPTTATQLATFSQDSAWWNRPHLAYIDKSAAAGTSQNYWVRVTDALGNTVTSASTNASIPSGSSMGSYAADTLSRTPTAYWRFGETSGATAYDWANGDDLTLAGTVKRSAGSAITGDSNGSADFPGTNGVPATTSTMLFGPQVFSLEAWVNTTSNTGGKIIGFGNNTTADSTKFDRHLYMSNTGQISFGVYANGRRALTSTAGFNNGAWHHLVGTVSPTGMALYIDGNLVGTNAAGNSAESTYGYWRIGGDSAAGWPNIGSSAYFKGLIDEVAIYPTALSAGVVAGRYQLGLPSGGGGGNQAPTASFTASVTGLTATLDASGSKDLDGTLASYQWSFGDGATQTTAAATVAHTYASAGTRTVTLVVTDNKGAASAPASSSVTTATAPPPPPPTGGTFAQDLFGRNVSNGLGTADVGGAWTTVGTASRFSVSQAIGAAVLANTAAGQQDEAWLTGASSTSSDVKVKVAATTDATGGGVAVLIAGRRIDANNHYDARLKWVAGNKWTLNLQAVSKVGTNATTTRLLSATDVTVPGTFAAGSKVNVRLQVTGTNPTTLRVKAWADGATEPTAWMLQGTDTSATLQTSGYLGFLTYLSGSSTTLPATRFSNFTAQTL